jgi:hypothetical protein
MDDSPQVIQTSGNGFIDKQKKNMLTYFLCRKNSRHTRVRD